MGDQENREYEDSVAAVVVDCQDPLVVFCQGVMMIVLSKLDVRSLARTRLVSTNWLALASCDQLWAEKLKELWEGKAHLPRIAKAPGLSKMEATSLSIMDGEREALNNQPELGEYCGPLDRRYFHEDGSITTGEGEKLMWGGNKASFTILTNDGGGQYVRIKWWPHVCVQMTNVWPVLSVIRNPDWSWELSDNLYCYSSIPDATDKPDGTGPHAPQHF